MKTPIYVIAFFMLTLLSCEKDELNTTSETSAIELAAKNYQQTKDLNICQSNKMLARGRTVSAYVEFSIYGKFYVITYGTEDNSGYKITKTHLSTGNCNVDNFPLDEKGNPKVEAFKYASSHDGGVNEVTFLIPRDGVDKQFCYAAQAELEGPEGTEIAWADGSYFDGSTLATYVTAPIQLCNESMVQTYSSENVAQ